MMDLLVHVVGELSQTKNHLHYQKKIKYIINQITLVFQFTLAYCISCLICKIYNQMVKDAY